MVVGRKTDSSRKKQQICIRTKRRRKLIEIVWIEIYYIIYLYKHGRCKNYGRQTMQFRNPVWGERTIAILWELKSMALYKSKPKEIFCGKGKELILIHPG